MRRALRVDLRPKMPSILSLPPAHCSLEQLMEEGRRSEWSACEAARGPSGVAVPLVKAAGVALVACASVFLADYWALLSEMPGGEAAVFV